MIFEPTSLKGVFLVSREPHGDSRGSFARVYCTEEFAQQGIAFTIRQTNLSVNAAAGTLRGLHYQVAPHAEAKLVMCISGAIFDVVVDLRPSSATYGQWISSELCVDRPAMVYIPEGCAHGFQTLVDNSVMLYHMSHAHNANAARGVRWDDPGLGIDWPRPDPVISERDRAYQVLKKTL